LGLRKVKKEGVAVIKLGVNERGCDAGASSGKVEGISYLISFFISIRLLMLISHWE